MARFKDYVPHGVIPATLAAFDADYKFDWAETRKHLAFAADVEGVTAITVNGHASEVHACTLDEQTRMMDESADEVGDRMPLICGVYADGSHIAADIAVVVTDIVVNLRSTNRRVRCDGRRDCEGGCLNETLSKSRR